MVFRSSNGTGNLAGTQAAGAGVNTLGGTVNNRFNAFDIGLPSPVRAPVRVRNPDSKSNILATYFTLCHVSAPPLKRCNIVITLLFYQICQIIASLFFYVPARIPKIFCRAAYLRLSLVVRLLVI